MSYTHERAVADGVNVGYHAYRIKTKITSEGSTIEAGEIVEKRDRMTRQQRAERLDEDYIYRPDQLDRDVVAPDQIRLILRTFRERRPEIFPGRTQVPKTLIFAKDDAHAEEITKITMEVFGEGNEFCQKITYKTTGEKPENIIKSFRNSVNPRIAVTVDMVATGTDIRPLECIIFLRDVRSRLYFDQMKGRGTRTIKPDDLRGVTPDAKSKDHFVIVDAVGVCEHAMSDTHSLNRKRGISFENLMQAAAEGRADEDDLESLAYRMARLDRKLDDKGREEIAEAAGGRSISQIVNKVLDGIDADRHLEKAKEKFQTQEPTKEQISQVARESVAEASSLFDSGAFRRTILEVKRRNEMIVDTTSIDELEEAGFDEKARQLTVQTVESFGEFLEKNRDELVALKIIYSKPYRMREITFKDIKDLANAIERPPYNLTPESLWSAYRRLDKSKVKDNPKKMLTDLISIVRYSIGKDDLLMPFEDIVNDRFSKWLETQRTSGREFSAEQKEWLVMIKEHIASSVSISLEDMELAPFVQKGGQVKFYKIFGEEYEKVLSELYEALISH